MHISIVGCGQLARMMALAGWRMGFTFSFLAAPGENRQCVQGLGDIVELTPNIEGEALYTALGSPQVITVEKEHVDLAALKALQPLCAVYPQPSAIEICQHRGREKTFLNSIGVPTAPFRLSYSAEALESAIGELDFPVIVKSCEEGYDGRGQWKISHSQQLESLLQESAAQRQLIIEGVVTFDTEVSLIAARSPNGNCAFYPLTENQHSNGILVSSIVPAELNSPALSSEAKEIAFKILTELDYVGVLSIEFFVVGDKLLVNELAPRVHNSGHWTQAAGICSQFENHLRSISESVLGDTTPSTCVGMINLLGQVANNDLLNKGNVELHLYNKSLRPNRKVGHINLWDANRHRLISQIDSIKQELNMTSQAK